MIKECNLDDKASVMDFLYANKEINLFIIGNINNYGFVGKNVNVFASYEEKTIKSVYARYRNYLVISTTEEVNKSFIASLVKKYQITDINGASLTLKELVLKDFKKRKMAFLVLKNLKLDVDTTSVEECKISDLPEYIEVVEEVFGPKKNTCETLKYNIEQGNKHIYVIKEHKKIVSTAATTAECDGLAMMVSVGTLKEYRFLGYATKCVVKLCKEMLKDHKTICLVCDNPEARKVYEKIGFTYLSDYILFNK